jgi:hypothetical protein
MLQEIYKARGEKHSSPDKVPNETQSLKGKKVSQNMLEVIQSMDEFQGKKKPYTKHNTWPDSEPVVFNFRMP